MIKSCINILVNMIKQLLLFVAVITAVQGNAVKLSGARQGSANKYFLFTLDHQDARSSIELIPSDYLDESTPASNVDPLNVNIQTIVVVHGHNGRNTSVSNEMIRNAFFNPVRNEINVNFIVVDWSTYTQQSYSLASGAVASVGTALGEFLKKLADQNRIALSNLHLIGFNLGAHVVGFAGRALGGAAARITGLDPSASQWGSNTPRLSKNDAVYVEVIHTDGDCLLCNGLGTAIGDVDFFVNGGRNQPGCLTNSCSHNRAYEVFAATLTRGEALLGRACTSNLQVVLNTCKSEALPFGGDTLFKRNSFNVYRVNTGRSYPY